MAAVSSTDSFLVGLELGLPGSHQHELVWSIAATAIGSNILFFCADALFLGRRITRHTTLHLTPSARTNNDPLYHRCLTFRHSLGACLTHDTQHLGGTWVAGVSSDTATVYEFVVSAIFMDAGLGMGAKQFSRTRKETTTSRQPSIVA